MPKISYVPSNRTLRIVWSTVAVVAVCLLVGLAVAVMEQSAQLERAAAVDQESKADRARLHAGLEAQQEAFDEANSRLVDAGQAPVAVPSAVPEALEGPAGETGERGPVGPAGPAGVPGQDGEDGADGRPGRPGTDGAAGTPGAAGSTGQAGSRGETGATGSQGDRGPAGEQGPAGPVGPQGPAGADGVPGASAYPFTFVFTVPGVVPGDPGTTYTVTCQPEGCSVSAS